MLKKLLVIVLVVVVLVSSAFVFLLVDWDADGFSTYQELTSLATNPLIIDTDGDKLLDGKSIVLESSDGRVQQLMEDGIILRVQSDGKYLFFTSGERGRSDIYWVDAKILSQR